MMTLTPPRITGGLQRYLADEHAPAGARRHVRARLAQWGCPQLSDTAELVASELITNASQATKGNEVGLELVLTARSLMVMAIDDSPDIPAAGDADDPFAESGRGLALVAALSARTGYFFTDDGRKVVWSEIPHGPAQLRQAAGVIETLRVAWRAAAIRSSTAIVGMPPPRSRRDRAGWVIPARCASSSWDSPASSRSFRTMAPSSMARRASSYPARISGSSR